MTGGKPRPALEENYSFSTNHFSIFQGDGSTCSVCGFPDYHYIRSFFAFIGVHVHMYSILELNPRFDR
jgi:hypothetical protein